MVMNNERWQECVGNFGEEWIARVAEWRGYSPESCRWLRDQGLIGVNGDGQVAFPVHGPDGSVVGLHCRPVDSNWYYAPKGCGTALLVIGDPTTAQILFVFESTWDGLAFLCLLGFHLGVPWASNTAVIITRGSKNTKLAAPMVANHQRVVAFPQNDPPSTNGRPNGAEEWLAGLKKCAAYGVAVVPTPAEHKDLNDWCRAGATADQIRSQIVIALGRKQAAENAAVALATAEDDQEISQPFPTECLPGVCAEMVRLVALNLRVPEGMPGSAVLSMLSAGLGAGLHGCFLPGKETFPNLFVLLGARSGTGKSEVRRLCCKPLYEVDQEIREQWRTEQFGILKAESDLAKREARNLSSQLKQTATDDERTKLQQQLAAIRAKQAQCEQQMREPQLLVEDVTVQRLAALLETNNEVITSLSSEAGDAVNNLLGRYNKLERTDESIYVKTFSGDPHNVDRQGKPSIRLKRPLMSLLWMVQPDKIKTLADQPSLLNGGFLARCLFYESRAELAYLDDEETEVPLAVSTDYNGLIRSILRTYRQGSPQAVQVDDEARQLLRKYYNETVDDRRAGEGLDSFAARHAEQACRIALCLHAARHGANAHTVQLDAATTRDAITLAKWFAGEQSAIFRRLIAQKRKWQANKVLALLDDGQEFVTCRMIHRSRIVGAPEEAERLLSQMVQKQLLVCQQTSNGGRPTVVYRRGLAKV